MRPPRLTEVEDVDLREKRALPHPAAGMSPSGRGRTVQQRAPLYNRCTR